MKPHVKNFTIVAIAAGLAIIGCRSLIDPAAEEEFFASLGEMTMTTFPAYVRSGEGGTYDQASADQVAAFLNETGMANAAASTEQVAIPGSWHSNQSLMWRESAQALTAHIQANGLVTDYALLAEYIFLGTGNVGGVHCYVVDTDGTVAFGILLNSHHDSFADADPKTVEDCTALLIDELQDRLMSPED
jgi:hypothetical protein